MGAHHYSKPTRAETGLALAKASLSLIPIAGAPAVELLGLLVGPTLEQRRDACLEDFGKRLKDLEESHKLSLESLRNNEQFADVAARAVSIAMKTADEEKKTALKNALSNVAVGGFPDSAITSIFLSLIESFTPWHIRLLEFFAEPRAWYSKRARVPSLESMGSLVNILFHAYPELAQYPLGQRYELLNLIWSDLGSAGMIEIIKFSTTVDAQGALQPRATELGRLFLKFIAEP